MNLENCKTIIDKWLQKLDFIGWTYDIKFSDETKGDVKGNIDEIDFARKHFIITLYEQYEHELEAIVVHELVHIHIMLISDLFKAILVMGNEETKKVAFAQYEVVEDRVVDRLTAILLEEK